MKNLFTTLFGIAMLLGVGGCSRESEVPAASRIIISPALTRVAGLNFEQGDQIGVTITRTLDVYAENVMMSYDGEVFSSPDLTWYDAADASTLTAYYPYLDAGSPATFSVAADQRAGCGLSDLLASVKKEVTPSSSAVGMVFRHLMVGVNIAVTNKTLSEVTEVRVGGIVLTADIDLTAQTAVVKPGLAASEINAYAVTPNGAYRVLVVPQTAALTLTVRTADGKSRSAGFTANTLLQGKTYAVSVIVEAEALIPTLSGEVADWELGGSLSPDTGGGENPKPDDGTMVCQGTTYRTVTYGDLVWMAENLRYIPAANEIGNGIWYPNNSSETADIEQYGMLYNFTKADALCPEGWQLPTEANFEALRAVLQQPYSTFLPMTGIYSYSQDSFKQFSTHGYLAGATQSSLSGMYKYLCNTSGQSLTITEGYSPDNGVSVRYVKNAQ